MLKKSQRRGSSEPNVALDSYFLAGLRLRDLSAESTVSSSADLQRRSRNVDNIDNADIPATEKSGESEQQSEAK